MRINNANTLRPIVLCACVSARDSRLLVAPAESGGFCCDSIGLLRLETSERSRRAPLGGDRRSAPVRQQVRRATRHQPFTWPTAAAAARVRTARRDFRRRRRRRTRRTLIRHRWRVNTGSLGALFLNQSASGAVLTERAPTSTRYLWARLVGRTTRVSAPAAAAATRFRDRFGRVRRRLGARPMSRARPVDVGGRRVSSRVVSH